MADPKKDDDEISLADIDPFFKQALEEKAAEEKRAAAEKKSGKTESKPKVTVSDADRALYDLAGAYLGNKAAKTLDYGVRVLPESAAAPLRQMGFPTAGAGTPMLPRPAPAAPVVPTMPVAPSAAPSALSQVAPVVGGPAGPVTAGGPPSVVKMTGPGSAVHNYGTAFGLPEIEAAKALDMTKNPGGVHDLLGQRTQALQRIQQMGGGYAENPRYGGIMTPEQSVGRGPRASYVQQPAIPASPDVPGGKPAALAQLPARQPIPTQLPAPAAPGALDKVMNFGKGAVRAAASSPLVTGALGGLATAEGVQEFLKRQSEGDIPGQILSGVGAAGGITAMAPHPMAKIIGGGLAAASPLSLYLYDKIRSRKQPMPQPRIPEPGSNMPPVEMIPR